MIKLETASLTAFLNPAMAKDQFFLAAAKSLDPLLADIRAQIKKNIVIANLAAQPENVIDFLAVYHFNLDYYDATLPLPVKRILCGRAILDKLQKGTPAAIKDLLTIAFNHAEIIEWWQEKPPAPHDTFRIVIADPLVDPVRVAKMVRMILKMKNVRSYFAGISSFSTFTGPPVKVCPAIASYGYQLFR